MPRDRSKNPKLAAFPGLYTDSRTRIFHIRHPITKKNASLKTRDIQVAKQIYAVLIQKWNTEVADIAASILLSKLDNLPVENTLGPVPTVSEWAKRYRVERIGIEIEKQGDRNQFAYGECTIVSKKSKKTLGDRTRTDYAGMLYNSIEPAEIFKTAKVNDRQILAKIKRYLTAYSTKPTTYNHQKSLLSNLFKEAKSAGYLDRNPCDDIDMETVALKTKDEKAKLYIPNKDYNAILRQFKTEVYFGKEFDGEYRARLCDLMLFMSSRAGDAVDVLDTSFDRDGHFAYTTNKTDELIWIDDESGELAKTVQWFRQWKRQNRIISKYLECHPYFKNHKTAGTPISVNWLSKQFAQAIVDAGYEKGRWSLRLIRHKGLTEEARKDEDNNKGGHRTESAKQSYRVKVVAKKVKNTLRNPRDEQ